MSIQSRSASTGELVLQAVSSTADDEPEWTDRALCSGKTDLFFERPGERQGRRTKREAIARSYCAACSVREQCRAYGRQNRENGIWGGENDAERALAGFAPRSIVRRSVAAARRKGLEDSRDRSEPLLTEDGQEAQVWSVAPGGR